MPDSNTTPYDDVLSYHDYSKHGLYSFAPSLGYLDWDSQPDPFRRYEGARQIELQRNEGHEGPSFDQALIDGVSQPADFNHENISRLFFDSMALSAWKSYQGSKWALRVNPSSGNLHPTEAYLVAGPIDDLFEKPTISHYLSENHCLEVRASMPLAVWQNLKKGFPEELVFIGLSSIYWREAWKYGERAFRYCNHDVGHALAAISISAAALGWDARLIENIDHDQLQTLLGLKQDNQPEEIEDADCLIAIYKRSSSTNNQELNDLSTIQSELSVISWDGKPNTLSPRPCLLGCPA